MHLSVIGAGWLGCHIAREALLHGVRVTLTCHSAESAERLHKEFSDLRIIQLIEPSAFFEALKDADEVVVCVAPGRTLGKDRVQAYRDCYLGVIKSLQLCSTDSCAKRGWTLISSTSVYGDIPGGCCDEDQATGPEPTGAVLFEMERQFKKLYGTRHFILRCGQLCGPDRALTCTGPMAALANSEDNSPSNLTPLPLILEAIEMGWLHHLDGVFNIVHPEHPSRWELLQRACHTLDTQTAGLHELQEPSMRKFRNPKWVLSDRWEAQRIALNLPSIPPLAAQPIWPPNGVPEKI